MKEREQFKSRIGFILLSAGCAIGIGNVWRFPYVVGENGGGIFVLFYLIFLLLIGVPILSMEFSVGRASKKSPVKSFKVLEKTNQKWHLHGYMSLLGNICLMIFYTTVSGWMLKYFYNFQFFISRMKIGSPFEASHTFYFSVFELLSVPDSESVLVSDLVFSVSSVLD